MSELEWVMCGIPCHELLPPIGELRGEEAGEVLLEEAEDEDVPHWRERRNQDDCKRYECQEISCCPPQRLHLDEHMPVRVKFSAVSQCPLMLCSWSPKKAPALASTSGTSQTRCRATSHVMIAMPGTPYE